MLMFNVSHQITSALKIRDFSNRTSGKQQDIKCGMALVTTLTQKSSNKNITLVDFNIKFKNVFKQN